MPLTPEQKAARQAGLGGSDAGVVAKVNPYKSDLRLYFEKRGELPVDVEETEAMQWGQILEDPVARIYAQRTGRDIRKQPIKTSTQHPFMLANIDRQITGDSKGPGILEVKTMNAFTQMDSVADLPDHIYLQGMHYLAVYDYAWVSFAILIGGQKLVWFDLDRDEQTIEVLIACEAEFWRRVELGDPPKPDGSDCTKELAKLLYPNDSGEILTLDSDDARKTAVDILEADQMVKRAEEKKTAMQNWFKFKMGEASKVSISGFGEITWKTARGRPTESVDIPKLKAEFPDAYDAVVTMAQKGGGRRFLVKPEKGLVKV